MVRIRDVKTLHDYWVRLFFTDGTKKDVDLERYLHGPIFDPIKKDLNLFLSVRVDHELGTIVWDNGADIDPDVLYLDLTPAWMEVTQEG